MTTKTLFKTNLYLKITRVTDEYYLCVMKRLRMRSVRMRLLSTYREVKSRFLLRDNAPFHMWFQAKKKKRV